MADCKAKNSAYSQKLLAQCVFGNQDARNLPDAFDGIARVLADRGSIYAFTGRSAFARFCSAQWTDTVIVRIKSDGNAKCLAHALQSKFAKSLSTRSSLRLELAFVQSEVERRFIERAPLIRWFDEEVHMATVEHLLWLALSSGQLQAKANVANLIQSAEIDWDTFDDLVGAKNPALVRRLEAAKRNAERTKDSTWPTLMQKRQENWSS